jgi:hypothetical protein
MPSGLRGASAMKAWPPLVWEDAGLSMFGKRFVPTGRHDRFIPFLSQNRYQFQKPDIQPDNTPHYLK